MHELYSSTIGTVGLMADVMLWMCFEVTVGLMADVMLWMCFEVTYFDRSVTVCTCFWIFTESCLY